MCGIAGILNPSAADPRAIQRMTDIIRHRGPDDEGHVLFGPQGALILGGDSTPQETWTTATPFRPTARIDGLELPHSALSLGHRRLAIQDLSPLGHQPMSYRGRHWIVHNGEVYNHVELRAELRQAGYEFISQSDTEVILAAYDHWGVDCLERFNGMWAFALYDAEAGELLLARDRFGVKPLYYWAAPDGSIAFGSEIKQFTVLPGWNAQVNGQRAYDFLVFGLGDHTDETMFQGVYQLRPGHRARLRLGESSNGAPGQRIHSEPWYRLRPRPFVGSFDDATSEFRALFVDAVRLRLRADVAIGSCLSGGLDSSSIVGVISRLLADDHGSKGRQNTFSACSTIAAFDERKWIDEVVRSTGVDAHYVYPSLEDLLRDAPQITWHQDEPFGSSSIYAQWHVFRLASQHGIKVMLDGQGADEQLAGYHMFFGARLARLFRGLRWLELVREGAAIRRRHGYGAVALARYAAPHVLPEALIDQGKRMLGLVHRSPAWLHLEGLAARAEDPFRAMGAFAASVPGMSIAQLSGSNLQMLLHWEDRNSMAHGIESRVPFLDYRLVEFVLGLPDEYKLFRGVTKRVLRDAMRSAIPASIAGRMDKLGFVTPEEVWVRELAPDSFRGNIEDTLDVGARIFRADALRAEMEAIMGGRKKFSFLPWRIANFGHWCRTYSVTP
ncbi:MAG: asparagine synthase (glutamine-hydrolyzing) [Piscinibacter sp.]|nr:asparagine synthase (glutamine-hydrolyzing) [Piscinibacter sp.]